LLYKSQEIINFAVPEKTRTGSEAHPATCVVDIGSHCSGVKHAGLGADLSLASSGEFQNGCSKHRDNWELI
jgi:hypothetical protein